jgi:monofunctional glycosyltransferase
VKQAGTDLVNRCRTNLSEAANVVDGTADGGDTATGAEPAITRPRSGARGPAVRLVRAALLLFAGYYALAVLLLVVYRFVPPPVTGVQLQRRVEALVGGASYEPERAYVPLSAMSRHAPRAVVAAEDGKFWRHAGFDLAEMRAAGAEALSGGRRRGASTITQQLMKNLFGCACRNPIRKVYDITLTPVAELVLGKERILELYLNVVEWGDGVYGVDAAARHHYGTSATALSRTQAAGLAALLPAPRQRTPSSTAGYRSAILRRMNARGW